MSLTHIETIELGSSQSSITFSSIPQDYDDLKVLISYREDAGTFGGNNVEINGSSANFSFVRLFGNGSSAASDSASTNTILFGQGSSTTANTFSNFSMYISNYTASQNKSISIDEVTETNATAANSGIRAVLWSNTAAITSLAFDANGANFVSGSVISLYGVTAGGDGTVSTA